MTTGFTEAFDTTVAIAIAADDFDSEPFDDDGDGQSNLDELIGGRDPFVDEDAQLPIQDFFDLSILSRMSVSRHIESHVPPTRPFNATSGTTAGPPPTVFESIDIDAAGNGTLLRNSWFGGTSHRVEGIRTVSEDSVSWEGNINASSDFVHSVSVNNTVTRIDENSRSLVEEVVGSNVGTYDDRRETSSNLMGHVIDDGPYCAPVSGTVITTTRTNRRPRDNYTRIISKALDDPYWRVTTERVDGDTTELFVRELIMLRSYCGGSCGSYTVARPEDKYFQCDFVDLQQ